MSHLRFKSSTNSQVFKELNFPTQTRGIGGYHIITFSPAVSMFSPMQNKMVVSELGHPFIYASLCVCGGGGVCPAWKCQVIMHYGRKCMFKLPADSRVESGLRNGGKDGSASCIRKRASTWARTSSGRSMIQRVYFYGSRCWKKCLFRHVNLKHSQIQLKRRH